MRHVFTPQAKMDIQKQQWTFKEHHPNIHEIHTELKRVGDEFRILLQSDVHWDNPHCELNRLTRHLDQAAAINAPVLDNGDWFCAMQGKYDPRSNKDSLRSEHQTGNYLDALVETSAEYLEPYKDILTVRGLGNHETSILKRCETNLTERLVERLRYSGSKCRMGGYSGWIRLRVKHAATRHQSFNIWYHHGSGGGGPVTRGVIQTNRTAVYVRNADVVWQGHTHDAWHVPIQGIKLNRSLCQVQTVQHHIRTPGYKNEYSDGRLGWHIERGAPPKPLGAAWLVVKWSAMKEKPYLHIELTEQA